MTTTTTGCSTCTSTAEISRGVNDYGQLLRQLTGEAIRTERASLLTAMAEVATTMSGFTRNSGSREGDMTVGDQLSWADASALLTRLSETESGRASEVYSEDDISDCDEWTAWDQLAHAFTAREHAAAVSQVTNFLLADNAKGEASTRAFAYERFLEAALACAAHYPASYPTEDDYRALQAVKAAG